MNRRRHELIVHVLAIKIYYMQEHMHNVKIYIFLKSLSGFSRD